MLTWENHRIYSMLLQNDQSDVICVSYECLMPHVTKSFFQQHKLVSTKNYDIDTERISLLGTSLYAIYNFHFDWSSFP